MAQLESGSSLALLAVPYQHLVVLITETGLRAGDACTLPSDALITDTSGWPCLRVLVSKMRAEHLVPLSARAADAVRTQQAGLARDLPGGTPWLFPSAGDPRLPVAYNSLRCAFNAWQERIGLHDEAGRPLHVTLHQLRHTFGTRLKMSGVASDTTFPGKRDHGAVRACGFPPGGLTASGRARDTRYLQGSWRLVALDARMWPRVRLRWVTY